MSPTKVRYEIPGKKQRPTPVSSFTGLVNDSESEDVLSSAMNNGLYNGSPAVAKENQKLPFKPLPTPTKSSQKPTQVDSSFDELEKSEGEPESTSRQTRSSFIQSVDKGKKKHRRRVMGLDGTYSSSDGSAPEDDGYTPSKKKAKKTPVKKTPTKARAIVIDSDRDSTLPSRSRRSSAKKQKSVTSSDSEDDIVHSNSRSSQLRKTSSRNANTFQGSPAITSSRGRGKKPVVIEESDSDEDDVVFSSQANRRQPQIIESEEDDILPPSPRKRVPRVTTEIEEDESQPIVSPLKRSRKPIESDDSDIVSSPMKRRRNSQREVELSSGSDFPSPSKMAASSNRSSTSKTPPRFTRQQKTARKHRTEKQKKMELLKRRRAGENIEQVTDSESDSDEGDENEELQKLSEFEDEEPSPESTRKPAKFKARKQNSDGEGDSDDFVIEDEDGPLGIPTEHLAQIPLEFTAAAHKPIKEHFRDVVEWMVHNKVNPGFEWKDPVYETAFRKVGEEAGGFADSKFVSTQWTAEFTKAIYARPNILIRDLEPGEAINVLGEAKCEACNHRKHMPTFSIQLKGKAYNKITLEDIESDSDEDSDEESDSEDSSKVSRDEKGQTLLSEDKQWFAGSVCKQNAENAHTLIHWKWHLNDWVVSHLEMEGECEPKKLAERDKMNSKRRHKYANAIVDRWQAEGVIKGLYKDFKTAKDTARELQPQKRGGWK